MTSHTPNILDRIVATKRLETGALKSAISPKAMWELAKATDRPPVSMTESLRRSPAGIIAEFKRRSPSKGEIAPMADVVTVTSGYSEAGAGAISVLTDTSYFGGATTDLALARLTVADTPLLRKDFIIEEYQIDHARVIGADAILLIAAILDPYDAARLADYAHGYGMQVLLEVHNSDEIASHAFIEGIDMVGVNNRDLTTFHTDTDVSARLADLLPAAPLRVAESGIRRPADIMDLRAAGFEAFLIGEALMSTPNPSLTLKEFNHAH